MLRVHDFGFQARELALKAHESGCKDAAARLGRLYHDFGFEADNERETAKSVLAAPAQSGDALAMHELSWVDYSEALRLDAFNALTKLAAQSCGPIVANCLAHCYYRGLGTTPDLNKAAELWTQAADIGNAESQRWLGDMYLRGEGVEKDLTRTVLLWHNAAAQGHAAAQENLARTTHLPKLLDELKAVPQWPNEVTQTELVCCSILRVRRLETVRCI